jgi:biopolymer transport protein ExbD
MADVDTGGGGGRGKKGGSKTKKKSTKIDMTAMVDVAFLLLTFFVLTAVIQDYSIMALTMPPKDDQNLERKDLTADVDEEKVVTIILGEKDTVHYFHRITDVEVEYTNFDPENGLAKVVQEHLRRYPKLCKEEKEKYGEETEGCWDPIFVIKSKSKATYSNLVDCLDEMSIQGAPKYAIDVLNTRDSLILIGQWDYENSAPLVP